MRTSMPDAAGGCHAGIDAVIRRRSLGEVTFGSKVEMPLGEGFDSLETGVIVPPLLPSKYDSEPGVKIRPPIPAPCPHFASQSRRGLGRRCFIVHHYHLAGSSQQVSG